MRSWPADVRRSSRFCSLLLGVIGLVGAFTAQAVTVQDIPDPRPDGWVVDLTGTLDPEHRLQIETSAQRVQSYGGELVAVLVKDLSGADPRTFATALGNRWNLNPRGALLLVATEARAAEIVLGYRVDGSRQVSISQRIMDRHMVPRFREGNYGAGLLAGARAVEQRILASEAPADAPRAASRAPEVPTRARPGEAPGNGFSPKELLRHPYAPALGGFLALGGLIFAYAWPRRPRSCERCEVRRVKLGEEEDDAHLSRPERMEENLGSVDYLLWACPRCGDILKVRLQRFFTRLKRCPECNYVTMSRVRTVLEHATTVSEGLAEVVEDCVHCDFHSVSHHRIPRVPEDDDDDNGWSSFSSSSSGGGSFSSGSGASGRW
ncbi:MAG: TPM domain-containing protein [Acidobacteriota bacterium]|nr:TPM domain-containing protein [Acidobacteriota bacterium]